MTEGEMKAFQKRMQADQEKLNGKIEKIQGMMVEMIKTMERRKEMIEDKIDTATKSFSQRLEKTCSCFVSEIEKAINERVQQQQLQQ
jgi:regulator of sirC expression with transglutaminase-like and TPR domain